MLGVNQGQWLQRLLLPRVPLGSHPASRGSGSSTSPPWPGGTGLGRVLAPDAPGDQAVRAEEGEASQVPLRRRSA